MTLPDDPDRRVLFFGDSMVAGTGDPTGLGWVGRVVAAAFAAGVPLTAHPLGVRGQSSVQIAARWRSEAAPRLDPECDCRVVFAFGTNDSGAAQVAPEQSVQALERVLDEAAQLGLAAFVVGPAPVGERARDDTIGALSAAFAAAAVGRGLPFVSVIEELRASPVWTGEAAAGDGAHPAAGGYALFAQLVLAGGFVDWLR
ncbi:MAG: acyl-CoA thioesterase [Solirubrobacteraceae bacterium]|jgi:lysophospholipase L1-like esterase|nr:acyl-CoA thioesterase [Solirubrobacteraceae bacterium]